MRKKHDALFTMGGAARAPGEHLQFRSVSLALQVIMVNDEKM